MIAESPAQRTVFGLAIALVVVVIAAGCGSTTTATETKAGAAPAPTQTGLGAPRENVLFGHIHSLTREGDRFEMRFDPAWFLSGETANIAAAEDGAVKPGEPVPNDNYVVDEGHRLFTYLVPADARVTVLTKSVNGSRITLSQLAELVSGKNPFSRPLFEPLTTGFWMRIKIDTVHSLDQQYRP
jgi:hypothetical protein